MSSVPVYQPGCKSESEWVWQYIRAAERICAGLLMVALTPVLSAIWLTIWFLGRKSPLIAHRRVGQHGSELWVLKFRTMWDSTNTRRSRYPFRIEYVDDQAGPALKSPADARVSGRFASFCRQHSLDELPQLIHVLRGQMSLVGPRPVTPAELEEIYGSNADLIVSVKPGLSGLWQVSGRNRLSTEERCRLDLQCAGGLSVRLYFSVLWRTIPEVFTGAGAW